jgi:hypothetical protein
MNAPMMTNSTANTPNTYFSLTYGTGTPLEAWEMDLAGFGTAVPIGSQFIIPSSLDTTQPVTVTLHCFSGLLEGTGNVRFQVQTDYKANGQELGSGVGGYAETLLTASVPVVAPANGNDLVYFTLTVSLTPALLAGATWADIVAIRVLTGNDDDYVAPVFLTAFSVNYTNVNT